jgi:hypothetical protein
VAGFEGQSNVEEAIWSKIHDKCFYLPAQASVCKGVLRGEFGYQANTAAGRQVLRGEYSFGEGFDEGTMELMEECARIRSIIPARSVNTNLKRHGWQTRWMKANEKTSSSISGLHFSHYKAGAKSDSISHVHALKTSIALRKGIYLDRWAQGLSIIPEKNARMHAVG